jgi:hypothetical protein
LGRKKARAWRALWLLRALVGWRTFLLRLLLLFSDQV